MKTRFFKNIVYIVIDMLYYLFWPISRIAIIRYRKKKKEQDSINYELFIKQIEEVEYYKLFKDRENCSYFNENDNKE